MPDYDYSIISGDWYRLIFQAKTPFEACSDESPIWREFDFCIHFNSQILFPCSGGGRGIPFFDKTAFVAFEIINGALVFHC